MKNEYFFTCGVPLKYFDRNIPAIINLFVSIPSTLMREVERNWNTQKITTTCLNHWLLHERRRLKMRMRTENIKHSTCNDDNNNGNLMRLISLGMKLNDEKIAIIQNWHKEKRNKSNIHPRETSCIIPGYTNNIGVNYSRLIHCHTHSSTMMTSISLLLFSDCSLSVSMR